MSVSEQTVSVLWFRGLLQAAESLGMSRSQLLQHCQLQEEQLQQPYARLTLQKNLQLWRAIENNQPSVNVGLAIGQQVKPSYFQLLALTLMQSRNLQEALHKSIRYTRLLSDGGVYRLEQQGEQAMIYYETQGEGFSRHQVDAVLVLLYNFASWLACRPLPLTAVKLQHQNSAQEEQYQQVFSAPVQFSAAHNALIFEASILAEPLSLSDHYLAQIHEQLLEQQLEHISQPSVTQQVQRCLSSVVELTLSRDDVAALLNLSSRSLQRKLNEEGNRFQALLDQERYQRACHYLAQSELTLTDISARLGFAESSVLTRAFRRWSRMTPIEYRQLKRQT